MNCPHHPNTSGLVYCPECKAVEEATASRMVKEMVMPLPCPFCSGKDIRFDEHGPMFVQIGERMVRNPDTIWSTCCYDCGATFPTRRSKERLIKCWNRRPDSLHNETSPSVDTKEKSYDNT